MSETPWQLKALWDRVADGRTAQDCPVAAIDWILTKYESLEKERDRYKAALERIATADKKTLPIWFSWGQFCSQIATEALSSPAKTRSERSEKGTGGELVGGVDGPDTMNEGAQG